MIDKEEKKKKIEKYTKMVRASVRRRVALDEHIDDPENPQAAGFNYGDGNGDILDSNVAPLNECLRGNLVKAMVLATAAALAMIHIWPGTVTPYAISTRHAGALGRRRAHTGELADARAIPRHALIPWSQWAASSTRNTSAFAVSGLDRHLFGKSDTYRGSLTPRIDSSASPSTSTWTKDRDAVARVMLFKLPRSGSTWVTELLNRRPTVFLSKEIIQAEFDGDFGPHARLQHLKRSLLWPTGKLASRSWGGRFATDYWYPGKWRRSPGPSGTGLDVIGFTVNPVKVEADYHKLCLQRPTAMVVAFVRTNVVKTVVSAVRGEATLKLCGANNLRAGDPCKIPPTLTIEVASFLRMLHARLLLEKTFMDLVYSLGRPVYEITYEDLQANPDATVAAFLSHLGLPGARAASAAAVATFAASATTQAPATRRDRSAAPEATNKSKSTRSNVLGSSDQWVKRTSDDLARHVLNYEELRAALTPSACLLAQFEVKTPGVSFPPCPMPESWLTDPPS